MHAESKKEAQRIGVSMILGLVLGLILYYLGESEGMNLKPAVSSFLGYIKPVGTIFIRSLKMVIVPLVLSSIFGAIVNLGTPENLGDMGKKALGYYFTTTAIAVFFGLVFVNLISPGTGADTSSAGLSGVSSELATRMQEQKGLYDTVVGVLTDSIPSNPVYALVGEGGRAEVLQIIVFAILFGIVALYNKKEAGPFVTLMESVEHLSMQLTHLIMKFAPIGIFVLMTSMIAKTGEGALKKLGWYMITVILGLACHACFLMFIACWRMKKSPLFILKGISAALFTAFSTSSSAATLPITMAAVKDNLGVQEETAEFVLPLGATVNMDGTALYESVAAIFIAQAYGIDLSLSQQIIIFLTASLAAIGAAAIPGAGMITMSIVLSAVGLPLDGVGLIVAVDRILDMFRTTVNVFGDTVGTIFVDSLMKKNKNSV